MMRFSICNETFEGWPWQKTCEFVANCGYDGIEVAPFTLGEDVRSIDDKTRKEIRQAAEAHGLQIVGLHWLLVSPKGLSATASDPAVRRATSEYLVALVHFCADLGGSIMVFGSPAQRRVEEGVSRHEAMERYVECLRPALDRAQTESIMMCIEPLPAPEANFILTLDEAAEVLRLLQHPAAKSILDVKSASTENEPVETLIRRHASIIAHVHANDANRRGPGFGSTDFKPILAALREIGYSGYVSVEAFDYTPDPETVARESLAYLRSCA